LAVVIAALFAGRGPTLFAATLTALFWDYFFLEPISTLNISNAEDAIMFGVYFVVACVLGQLTSRLRARERAERQGERRSTALYELAWGLGNSANLEQMLGTAVRQMEGAFGAQIAVLLADAQGGLSYHCHPASTYDIEGPEQPVAQRVFEHGQPAGKFTRTSPQSQTLFLPLIATGETLGVIGLRFKGSEPPTREQKNLLDAFSQQIAFALDRQRLRAASENARLLGESERLSKTLLNSMSHEIRTPLAVIKTATTTLLDLGDPELSHDQRAMVSEIQEATERLNGLVGKVLDATWLESGSFKPKLSLCDLNDLIHVALKLTKGELAGHRVSVELAPGLPLVLADFVLLQQVLTNLLSNAAIHTPPGTAVEVSARVRDGQVFIAVADRGPGIPPESLPRIFDKFYRAPGAPTGGTGLGLSLVKGFVEAQHGCVKAENRQGGGTLFTIGLPLPTAAEQSA